MLEIGADGLVGGHRRTDREPRGGTSRARRRSGSSRSDRRSSGECPSTRSTSCRASTAGSFSGSDTSPRSPTRCAATRGAPLPRDLVVEAKRAGFGDRPDRGLDRPARVGRADATRGLGHPSLRQADRHAGGGVSGSDELPVSDLQRPRGRCPGSGGTGRHRRRPGVRRVLHRELGRVRLVQCQHGSRAQASLATGRSSSTTTPRPSAPTTTSATGSTSTS